MIQISGGSIRYGEEPLFEGLDWLVTPKDRVGIVGANGSGKTTLLKILAGIEHLEQGQVTRQKGLRIGYLPQDGLRLSGRSVFDECLSVFDETLALEREQEELANRMAILDPSSGEYKAVADRYQWAADRYHALDGYTKEAQVGTVLAGLEFPREDWGRRTEEFSGGWQMRIALAKLLLEKPNLLLLDEPTNHLDLDARNWLEGYLNNYPYAFAVVSHDRYFLDVTVRRIVEIWNREVHFYSGQFTRYEEAKQQRLHQIKAAYKNQQDHIRHLESFINRFRYKATKAAQVQSRVKELEKIERIELPQEEETIHFKFPQPAPSGRVVIELQHAAKSYGPQKVFGDVNLVIERGDRIALIGHNGAGKSTLIRVLAGSESLSGGKRILGHKVTTNYFAQDQYQALDPNVRVLDDLISLVPRSPDTELRSLLGCFLFTGDDVYKPIGVLSGGERNRYALARVLVRPTNFLLLDEPTNHLDLRAKEVLLEALLDFTGTIVFVSHDRYFIDKLATKVCAVGSGDVVPYPGNYEDYLWQAREGVNPEDDKTDMGLSQPLQAALKAAQEKDGSNASPRRKRMNPLKAERIHQSISELEAKINRLESEIEDLQEQLAKVSKDHRQSADIASRMDQLRQQIRAHEHQWEQLTEKLEAHT